MIKNSKAVILLAASFSLVKAQDISTIRNTVDVYSNTNTPGSAKYQAMAGSMGALGGELSSINSNPAGLGVFIANDIQGTLTIDQSKNSSKYNGRTIDYTINNTDLGQVGAVATFMLPDNSAWKFVNVGFNYSTQSLEDYSETAGNSNISIPFVDLNTTLDFDGHAYNRYGNITKSSLGVGANYNNDLYVGGALHFKTADLEQYDTASFLDSGNNNSVEIFNKQFTPFTEQSNGFAASLGVIKKINNQVRLGASVETPTWWQVNRIYNAYDFPTDETYREDRRITSPLKATLSAAFVASKEFSVNVDYTLGLTKPKYKVYGNAESELNNFFEDNYNNLSELKAGAEYRLMGLRLRAGYAFANSPFDNISLPTYGTDGSVGNSNYDDFILGKRNTVAAGIGYDFQTFYIDAAYQNISSTYNSPLLQGTSTSDFNTGYFSNNFALPTTSSVVSEVKNKQNNFSITLGYKF